MPPCHTLGTTAPDRYSTQRLHRLLAHQPKLPWLCSKRTISNTEKKLGKLGLTHLTKVTDCASVVTTVGHYQPGPGFNSDLEVNGFVSHHQSSEHRLLEKSDVKLHRQKYFEKSKLIFNLQSICLYEKLILPWSLWLSQQSCPVRGALQPSNSQCAATSPAREMAAFLLSASGGRLDSHVPSLYVSAWSAGVDIMVRFIYQIPALIPPPLTWHWYPTSSFQKNVQVPIQLGKKISRSSAKLFNAICCKALLCHLYCHPSLVQSCYSFLSSGFTQTLTFLQFGQKAFLSSNTIETDIHSAIL